uniref:F-box domain-containing protein n=1 Tax=Setaria digitata TaxID=48799 RepID=A0A915Q2K8_9BILA
MRTNWTVRSGSILIPVAKAKTTSRFIHPYTGNREGLFSPSTLAIIFRIAPEVRYSIRSGNQFIRNIGKGMDAITESPGLYRPISRKYDTIDRRYKFFKANSAACMQMHYPLERDEGAKRVHHVLSLSYKSYTYNVHRKILNIVKQDRDGGCQGFESNQEILTTVNDLPDDILLLIFGYCHPIDLINCFSLVSRRWNNLANHSSLLSEVRVLVNNRTLAYKSVKDFFERSSQQLRKLCIDCTVLLPSTECSSRMQCEEEWNQMLKLLFEDENTFPKMENFFIGDMNEYWDGTDAKLLAWNRPLKNLCNLEEFRLACGDQYCNLTTEGMIALFTLPDKEPQRSFPYKLRNLALTEFQMCNMELVKIIAQNHLVLLDLSKIGEFYDDEVWDNLCDDILPNLRFLRLHDNKADIEILQRLNLRRPRLLITIKMNHFINWTETENGCVFHDTFNGDINELMNDLCQVDGFGCCGAVTYFPSSHISA